MWRTCRSPIMPASAARAGIAFFTAAEPSTSACRVMAPISTVLAVALIPESSLIKFKSIKSEGDDSRSFIACTRLCPPARYLASDLFLINETASFELAGRWYSNACMAFLLELLPHGVRRRWHRYVLHAERVGDRVHHRRRRADGAGLAAALHAERVVRAGRLARVDFEHGDVARARDAVVGEGAGEQLAGVVVPAALGE